MFVPRPETELVVDLAAAELATAHEVVDLCAGSGAIALAVAHEYRGAHVTAVERAPAALAWLRRNADLRGAAGDPAVDVVAADVVDWRPAGRAGAVDVVLANPPYVPDGTAVGAEVVADPAEAVFAGPDGLALVPAVAATAAWLLRPGGLVVVEHDDTHAAGVREALAAAGFDRVRTERDLAGRERFATGRRTRAARRAAGWCPVGVTLDCIDAGTREAAVEAAVRAVRAGQLVVLPTDTLYGIGADAFDGAAVAALLAAKGRGRDMPVPVLVGSWDTVDGLVSHVDPRLRDLVEAFWPGGLTIVVEHARSLTWDLGDSRGHRRAADAAAPGRPRRAARGRPDGGVQREPQRAAAGQDRRGGPRPARRRRLGLPRRRTGGAGRRLDDRRRHHRGAPGAARRGRRPRRPAAGRPGRPGPRQLMHPSLEYALVCCVAAASVLLLTPLARVPGAAVGRHRPAT